MGAARPVQDNTGCAVRDLGIRFLIGKVSLRSGVSERFGGGVLAWHGCRAPVCCSQGKAQSGLLFHHALRCVPFVLWSSLPPAVRARLALRTDAERERRGVGNP